MQYICYDQGRPRDKKKAASAGQFQKRKQSTWVWATERRQLAFSPKLWSICFGWQNKYLSSKMTSYMYWYRQRFWECSSKGCFATILILIERSVLKDIIYDHYPVSNLWSHTKNSELKSSATSWFSSRLWHSELSWLFASKKGIQMPLGLDSLK